MRVERLLDADEHVERVAERFVHEAGPVEADTVVMTECATVLEHRTRAGIPRGPVDTSSRASVGGWPANVK